MQRHPHHHPSGSDPQRQSLRGQDQSPKNDDIVANALNQHAERKVWGIGRDFPTSWREALLIFWRTCHRVDEVRRSWPVEMLFSGAKILLIVLLFCFLLVTGIVTTCDTSVGARCSFIFSRMVRRPEFDFCTPSSSNVLAASARQQGSSSEMSIYHHIDPDQLLSHSFEHFAALSRLAPNISITLDLTNRATIDIEAIYASITTPSSRSDHTYDSSLIEYIGELKTKLNAQQSLLSAFNPSLISHLTDARHRTNSLRRIATSSLRRNSQRYEWTRTMSRIFLTFFPSLYTFTDEGQLEARLSHFLETFLSDLQPHHDNATTLYSQSRDIWTLALYLQQQQAESVQQNSGPDFDRNRCILPPPPSFLHHLFFSSFLLLAPSPSLPPCSKNAGPLHTKLSSLYEQISEAKETLEALWRLHQEVWVSLESLLQQGLKEEREAEGARILANRFVMKIDREGSLGAAERLGSMIDGVLG